MSKLVAVKIRGSVDADRKIRENIENLGLVKKNQARIMEDNDSNRGMMNKAKDYIAYGEVEDDVAEQLGSVGETVRLSPPSGGFKSTKRQYHQGGSLGKRGDMEDLLKRMM